MAFIAVKSDCILMYIFMARKTIHLCVRKYQTFMTGTTIYYIMLTSQFEVCLIMIEFNLIFFNFPGYGFMAGRTIHISN
jgi:hypothetical protein